MKIHVRYLNILRNSTGLKEETMELPGENRVTDLLDAIMQRHDRGLEKLFYPEEESGELNPLLRIAARNEPRFLSPEELLAEGGSYDIFIASFGG